MRKYSLLVEQEVVVEAVPGTLLAVVYWKIEPKVPFAGTRSSGADWAAFGHIGCCIPCCSSAPPTIEAHHPVDRARGSFNSLFPTLRLFFSQHQTDIEFDVRAPN